MVKTAKRSLGLGKCCGVGPRKKSGQVSMAVCQKHIVLVRERQKDRDRQTEEEYERACVGMCVHVRGTVRVHVIALRVT